MSAPVAGRRSQAWTVVRGARALVVVLAAFVVVSGVASPGAPVRRSDARDWILAAQASQALLTVRDPAIVEASGLAVDRESAAMFVVQDAGTGDTSVRAVGPSGETALTVEVTGIANEDWEDLAYGTDEGGGPALFIGDIGDAFFARRDAGLEPRTEYSVTRIRKPSVDVRATALAVEAQDVRHWRFRYADDATHNAESLLVQPGTNRLFVVDKTEDPAQEAFLWAAPEELQADGVHTLTSVAPVPVTGASGGAFSPDGDRLVIRNADTAYIWDVAADAELGDALAVAPSEVALPLQRQGEGIDFTADGRSLVVNSEGAHQPIHRVELPAEPTPVASSAALEGARRPSPWLFAGLVSWIALVFGGLLVYRLRQLPATNRSS